MIGKRGVILLYIVRHGQTEFNLSQKLQGTCNSNLTDLGVSEAKLLAKKLRDIDFVKCYSSQLGRAVDTAKILIEGRDIPHQTDERMAEMSFGSWEGKEKETLLAVWPDAYRIFFEAPDKYVPEDGETYEEVFERAASVIPMLLEEAREKNILLVSHGVWIKVFIALVKNRPLKELWAPPYIQNTALTVMESDGDQFHIVLEGDCSHLA